MKSRVLLYHLLFWLAVYIFWVVVFRSYSFTLSKTITVEFCYLLFITADFYAINNFIIPKFLLARKYVLFVSATIAVIALSALLRSLVSVQMNAHFFHAPPVDFTTLYLNSVINITLWVLLITIGKMIIDRIKIQQQLEILEKERIGKELDYLKAQINPHALFNSLNTIYGHIDKNNPTARNILLQFSELLRYQLYDCGAETVSLEKEIMYIKNYVAFHRLRKDENLVVSLCIEPVEAGLKIVPLLLIVLIENAFKFVSNFPDKENKISINICIKENVLHSSVINTRELQPAHVSGNSNGIGIANLKRRLVLLYAQKHELITNSNSDFYEAKLIIDLS